MLNVLNSQSLSWRAAVLPLLVVVCAYAADAAIIFSIPTQPLRAALKVFSEQSGLQVVYFTALVPDQMTSPIVGRYDARDALTRLLRGSELTFEFVNVRTVAIRSKGAVGTGSTLDQSQEPAGRRFAGVNSSGVARPPVPTDASASGRAASTSATESEAAGELAEVVVVGSRVKGRATLNSMVPVDVIEQDEIAVQGFTDLNSMLQTEIPSFDVSAQPNTDAAAFMRPANLRGLAPDDILVLVNGKRRHRGAVISSIGGGVSDGAQGVDLASMPMSAIKKVEVLRDGAAAQYGSDAIAGVIDFELNDSAQGFTLMGTAGQYRAGDGKTYQGSVNVGLPLSPAGFANFSLEISNTAQTNRSIQRPDAAAIAAAGNTAVGNPAQIWGSPAVRDNVKVFGNLGLDLTPNRHAYLFGNYSRRTVASNFFYRSPNKRAGVYSGDGGVTRLVLDLNSSNSATNNCSPLPVAGDVAGAANAAYLAGQAALGRNCFLFNQLFPGGFQPIFSGRISDAAGVIGVRGHFEGDKGPFAQMLYDFSLSYGQSRIGYQIDRTINASLGPNTPTSFHPGDVVQSEQTLNADFSRQIDGDRFLSPLNVAFGADARREQYQKIVGDPNSFANGPFELQGATTSSNGFGGISPNQAGTWSRSNAAEYVDLEAGGTKGLTLGAAVRHENFQEFGGTNNYKGSFLWRPTTAFGVRGSYGTGFRAPTVGQVNNDQINTVAQGGGIFTEQGTISPNNPVAIALGARRLTPETSRNTTVGVLAQASNMTLTADYFSIKVRDRLAVSSTIAIGPTQIAILQAAGITGAGNLTGINFLVNDFDTTTEGVDIVATWRKSWRLGDTKVTTSFNNTSTAVDRSKFGLVGSDRIDLLENLLPKTRASLTLVHKHGGVGLLSRVNYYGTWSDGSNKYGAKLLLDLEASFLLGDALRLSVGGQNILDTYPDKSTRNTCCGILYDEYSPFGFNGGFIYVTAGYKL